MKLIAMLSFFQDDEQYLVRNIEDLHDLGVRSIIACDGSYKSYPSVLPRSNSSVVNTLHSITLFFDMALLLYQPIDSWNDDEVEKRQTMLNLAWQLAKDGDWFVIWDCDYKLIDAPRSERIRDALDDTSQHVGEVSFTEDKNLSSWHPMRMFLRAQPIKMAGNHHTYILEDGRQSQVLSRPVPNMASALDLSSIKIHHRVHERDPERRAKQTKYYEVRDGEELED